MALTATTRAPRSAQQDMAYEGRQAPQTGNFGGGLAGALKAKGPEQYNPYDQAGSGHLHTPYPAWGGPLTPPRPKTPSQPAQVNDVSFGGGWGEQGQRAAPAQMHAQMQAPNIKPVISTVTGGPPMMGPAAGAGSLAGSLGAGIRGAGPGMVDAMAGANATGHGPSQVGSGGGMQLAQAPTANVLGGGLSAQQQAPTGVIGPQASTVGDNLANTFGSVGDQAGNAIAPIVGNAWQSANDAAQSNPVTGWAMDRASGAAGDMADGWRSVVGAFEDTGPGSSSDPLAGAGGPGDRAGRGGFGGGSGNNPLYSGGYAAGQLFGAPISGLTDALNDWGKSGLNRYFDNFGKSNAIYDYGQGLLDPKKQAEADAAERASMQSGINMQRDEGLRRLQGQAGRGGAMSAGGQTGVLNSALRAQAEGESKLAQDQYQRMLGRSQAGAGMMSDATRQQYGLMNDAYVSPGEIASLLMQGGPAALQAAKNMPGADSPWVTMWNAITGGK